MTTIVDQPPLIAAGRRLRKHLFTYFYASAVPWRRAAPFSESQEEARIHAAAAEKLGAS